LIFLSHISSIFLQTLRVCGGALAGFGTAESSLHSALERMLDGTQQRLKSRSEVASFPFTAPVMAAYSRWFGKIL
jgi:phenylalanyl-tRNA synthetase alpha subunit